MPFAAKPGNPGEVSCSFILN